MTSIDNVSLRDAMKLKFHDFEEEKSSSPHVKIKLKGISTVTLYNSGKLLIQGSEENVKKTLKLSKKLGLGKKKEGKGIAIGSDETLKGDTFGGIVVAAFMADEKIREDLKEIGVRDSKLLLRPEIVELAKKIMETFPDNYHVENLFPEEYNKLNIKWNVTHIMDLLHRKCYKELSGNKKIKHIVDKYPGCKVGDVIETKAESKYPEVAAASIIARYEGLKQIKELEHRAGFFIPLGSTHVDSALLEIKKKSLNPKDYVKLKFRNVKAFF